MFVHILGSNPDNMQCLAEIIAIVQAGEGLFRPDNICFSLTSGQEARSQGELLLKKKCFFAFHLKNNFFCLALWVFMFDLNFGHDFDL